MSLAVVLGTRPEIIKISPIIKACEKQGVDYFILHTGQHYSRNMDVVFFEQLGIPQPKYNMNSGSNTDIGEVAGMMFGLQTILSDERPDIVLVEGDTNTVLATALAASKLHIKIGHVEAGLRSYDRTMPEEINRILADHLSDYLFAPTVNAVRILGGEGICNNVWLTGNTIVDVVKSCGQKRIEGNYVLLTLHRQENVDDKKRFTDILAGVDMVCEDRNVVYPVHPRAVKMIQKYGLQTKAVMLEPVDYFSFIDLLGCSKLVMTDSGGVQEEACVLGVPCVTLRDNTERPETVDIGANILAGSNPDNIRDCVKMMSGRNGWQQPFGDGNAGEKIVELIRREHG